MSEVNLALSFVKFYRIFKKSLKSIIYYQFNISMMLLVMLVIGQVPKTSFVKRLMLFSDDIFCCSLAMSVCCRYWINKCQYLGYKFVVLSFSLPFPSLSIYLSMLLFLQV